MRVKRKPNAIAKDLRTPKYRLRKTALGKVYNRAKNHQELVRDRLGLSKEDLDSN